MFWKIDEIWYFLLFSSIFRFNFFQKGSFRPIHSFFFPFFFLIY